MLTLRDYLFYEEPGITLYCGDATSMLATLPEGGVQTCITSPPYWGLRDYGTSAWEGGDSECPHRILASGSSQNKGNNNREGLPFATECGLCGASRVDKQLGLEPTPEAYVAALVDIFREVRRVLRDDGTLWLNLGDSYVSSPRGNKPGDLSTSSLTNPERQDRLPRPQGTTSQRNGVSGLKPKDLVGIPWRVAFALQADGWWLRSDIIWAKPNPMPESVTDRPTKAHEYLFLLTKSERYFYDAEAIKESAVRAGDVTGGGRKWSADALTPNGRHQNLDEFGIRTVDVGRNRRSVWTIATEPYPEAHFATFPTDLVKPCVLAGSRPSDLVLDPFAGSGTTLYVAKEFGRRASGIELNPEYCQLAVKRLRQEVLPFS